jgi:hypothetical protein
MGGRKLAGLGLLLALAVAGCRGKYTPVPTEGVVTLDGKPVEGATVQFIVLGDDKEGRIAWGTTDKEGKFRLSTKGANDGALPRDYHVTVVKLVPLKPEAEAAARKRFAGSGMTLDDIMYEVYGNGPRHRNIFPEKYGKAETTPFRVTIPHDGPVLLEMKSQ